MAEPEELDGDMYVVAHLRRRTGLGQTEFGRKVGVSQSDISKYERGEAPVPEAVMRRMAGVAEMEWPLVGHLRRFFAALLAAEASRRTARGAEPPDLAALQPALLAVAPYLIEDRAAGANGQSLEEARREADETWTALERFEIPRRRRLIEQFLPASRAVALAARACEASVAAAAQDARKALELAELGLFIAGRAPEELRSRAEGYCWGHVGNSRRVAEDFDGADEAFARAWELWGAGAGVESELLPEWRLLAHEASLRRVQHRYPQALKLLDRARLAAGEDRVAAGRLLLSRELVYSGMGDIEAALAALAEAAPLVEASGDPRLLLVLLFNRAEILSRRERHAEAAALLPQVRELAQDNALDLVRVAWLEARVAAGQGREEEATAKLEQVRQEFLDRALPYDAALAGLDLAELYLRAGRTAEACDLMVDMEEIFNAKGSDREVEMARRVQETAKRGVAMARTQG